jgi:hypothetical protein
MAISSFSGDVNVIAALHDNPVMDDNLTAQQFKEKFDYASGLIKAYINGTLVTAINKNIGDIATNTTAINRFLITDNPYRNNTTTDIENGEGTNGEKANGVRKILIHNQLYILRGNTVYRADGRIADGKEVMP